jgi:tRNA(Ile2) C34 agmatinyltransferase TiaS
MGENMSRQRAWQLANKRNHCCESCGTRCEEKSPGKYYSFCRRCRSRRRRQKMKAQILKELQEAGYGKN